jgi:hypothetical protein
VEDGRDRCYFLIYSSLGTAFDGSMEIGASIFKTHVMTLDQDNKQIQFSLPNGDKPVEPVTPIDPTPKGGLSRGALVVIIILAILIVAALLAGAIYYRKRRLELSKRRYSEQADLLKGEHADSQRETKDLDESKMSMMSHDPNTKAIN